MITAPRIGSVVRVQTKFGERIGTVVPNQKWNKPDTFCMTGDEHIAVRNIALQYTRSIEYIKGAPTQNAVRAFRVKSTDKKREYTVIVRGNKVSCNCVGFTYHHKCKHATAVKAKLK